MYGPTLFVHSWLRWLVLALGIALLAAAWSARRTGATWGQGGRRLELAFLAALDTQVLIGTALFWLLSPISRAGVADIGAALGDPVLRFYSVEHAFGMLVGLFVAHVGLRRAARGVPERRAAGILKVQLFWVAVTVVSVPWPFLEYGRPLFRF